MGVGPSTRVWVASQHQNLRGQWTSSPSRDDSSSGVGRLSPSSVCSEILASLILCGSCAHGHSQHHDMSSADVYYLWLLQFFFLPILSEMVTVTLRDMIQMSHLEWSTPASLFSVYNPVVGLCVDHHLL